MKFKVYTFLNQRLILSNGFECQFKDGVYETEEKEVIELLKKVPNVYCEKPSILQTIKNNGTLNNNSSEATSSVEQVEVVDNNSANETSKRGRPSKK